MKRSEFALSPGPGARRVEHAGSTSVPDPAAKPVIDIVPEVPNSADESSYRPAPEIHGYELTIREPEWHEHRMLRRRKPEINLHVFSKDCPEITRMPGFRDWLRTCPEDRRRYEEIKRALAARP